MSISPSQLVELAKAGVDLHLISQTAPSTVVELARLAAQTGSKLTVGCSVAPSTLSEIAKLAPKNVVIIH